MDIEKENIDIVIDLCESLMAYGYAFEFERFEKDYLNGPIFIAVSEAKKYLVTITVWPDDVSFDLVDLENMETTLEPSGKKLKNLKDLEDFLVNH